MGTLQFDDNKASKLNVLAIRIVKIAQAIETGLLTVADLEAIAGLTTAQLYDKAILLFNGQELERNRNNEALKIFYDLLIDADKMSVTAPGLEETLTNFENISGDYLSLLSLGVREAWTTASNLNDMAQLFMLLPFLNITNHKEELETIYHIETDDNELIQNWLEWVKNRPLRLPLAKEPNGVFEKFMQGSLKKEEWLTDFDIKSMLEILNLKETNTHITPFTSEDLKYIFHFEREKHTDNKPYSIPLILNHREDGHSFLSSRGIHWTFMMVDVDPITNIIQIHYDDSLSLSKAEKKKIKQIVTEAIFFTETPSSYLQESKQKLICAYPNYKNAHFKIKVKGSGQQRDSYSCGYRALKKLVESLCERGIISRADYEEFLNCHTSVELRNFVHSKLLTDLVISEEDYKKIVDKAEFPLAKRALKPIASTSGEKKYQVNPAMVKGLQENNQTHLSKVDWEKLEKIADEKKLIDALLNTAEFEAISKFDGEKFDLNLVDFLSTKSEDEKIIRIKAIFKALRINANIVKLKLNNLEHKAIVQEQLDLDEKLTSFESDDDELNAYAQAIILRNKIVCYSCEEYQTPWDKYFAVIIPNKLITGCLDLKFQSIDEILLEKIINYCQTESHQFFSQQNTFSTLQTTNPTDFSIRIITKHLALDQGLPFNEYILSIVESSQFYQDLNQLLPLLAKNNVKKIEFHSTSTLLNAEQLKTIIAWVKSDTSFTTYILIKDANVDPKLVHLLDELNNQVAKNIREKSEKAYLNPVISKEDTLLTKFDLGVIGNAIYQKKSSITIETDIVQEQEQELEQQMELIIDDDRPDEDELVEKTLIHFSGNEEGLLQRNSDALSLLYKAMTGEIKPAEEVWDSLIGKNSLHFSNSIKRLTNDAAIKLINHRDQLSGGINLQDPPHGFFVEQDDEKNIILCYDQINPRLNLNASPLTVKFSRPMPADVWHGNIKQLLTDTQIDELWKKHCKKWQKKNPHFSKDECARHFFYIKDLDKPEITRQFREEILHAVIENLLSSQPDSTKKYEEILSSLTLFFGKELSDKNILALLELIRADGGILGLEKLFTKLDTVKKIGAEFFDSFKRCFIDNAKNLSEFLHCDEAFEQLSLFSAEQKVWWTELTEQQLNPDDGQPNYANLTELVDGFTYFYSQFQEFDVALPLSCRLDIKKDMRAGLYRLLVILRNAKDINEQVAAIREGGLSLDFYGPYYASEYEGFKLVTADMMLELGKLFQQKLIASKEDAKIAKELDSAQPGFVYRTDKEKIGCLVADSSAVDESDSSTYAQMLRYLGTFNQRAPLVAYQQAYKKISEREELHSLIRQDLLDRSVFDSILTCFLSFSIGKNGQYFSDEDVDNFLQALAKTSEALNRFTSNLKKLHNFPIKPTLKEIVAIIHSIHRDVEHKYLGNILWYITELTSFCGEHATKFFEALVVHSKNTQAVKLDLLVNTLIQLDVRRFNSVLVLNREPTYEELQLNVLIIQKKDGKLIGHWRTTNRHEMKEILETELGTMVLPNLNEYSTDVKLINDLVDVFGCRKTRDMFEKELKAPIYFNGENNIGIRAAIPGLLAILNVDKEITYENYFLQVNLLLKALTEFNTTYPNLTGALIELISKINPASAYLPTIDDIIQLATGLAEKADLDFNGLFENIKSTLPNCEIIMQEIKPIEITQTTASAGIYNHIAEIKIELLKSKKLIKKFFGDNFFSLLDSAEGPNLVMSSLESFNLLEEAIEALSEIDFIELKKQTDLNSGIMALLMGMEPISFSSILDLISPRKISNEIKQKIEECADLYLKGDITDKLKLKTQMAADKAVFPIVKNKAKTIFSNIYQKVIEQNVEKMKHPLAGNLSVLINTQLSHPILTEQDFGVFVKSFNKELSQLDSFFQTLNQLYKNCYTNFPHIISAMATATHSIGKLSLGTITVILKLFAEQFNKKEPFPLALFKQIFELKPIENNVKELEAKILKLITDLSVEDNKLTGKELELVGLLLLKQFDLIEPLLKLKAGNAYYYADILQLLLTVEPFSIEVIEAINLFITNSNKQLNPKMLKSLLNFYQSKGNDFISLIHCLTTKNLLVTKEIASVLDIIFKAANQPDPFNQQMTEQLLEQLCAMDEQVLKQVKDIYSSSPYPTVNDLLLLLALNQSNRNAPLDEELKRNLLSSNSRFIKGLLIFADGKVEIDQDKINKFNLFNIKNEFDLDPTNSRAGEKGKDLLAIQFDKQGIINHIEKLFDLNFDRPLLYTQREKLYHWFIYINSLGGKEGLRVNPQDLDKPAIKLPIKDMTRAQIKHLLEYYREKISQLNADNTASKEELIRLKLEYLAIAREVMYRTTGKLEPVEAGNFPRSTQMLYLLNYLLLGTNYIGEMQTGQGKSLTAALMASLLSVEGKTVDVCTSTLPLANKGLEEHQAFFDYMDIPTKLITPTTKAEEYVAGGVYYSSFAERALFFSKLDMANIHLPESQTAIIADEVDFATVDEDKRFRLAVSLDGYAENPYQFIYQQLIEFIDSLKFKAPLSDDQLLIQAKELLEIKIKKFASLKDKAVYKQLKEMPDIYDKKLTTWLIAAGNTAKMIDEVEPLDKKLSKATDNYKYRIVNVIEKQNGKEVNVSKACQLTASGPDIQAQLSNSVQQFLHMRLRTLYRDDIAKKVINDFSIPCEKTYQASYNSYLVLKRYGTRLGMTGTAGDDIDIKIQQQKYGFRFISIPPFVKRNRESLKPIFTSASSLKDSKKEDEEHIDNIVKEILRQILSNRRTAPGPILVSCASKLIGEKVNDKVSEILANSRKYHGYEVQQFYGSNKSTAEERNAENEDAATKASKTNQITISTVFGRGTDIKPSRGHYLHVIVANAKGSDAEDVIRRVKQIKGRTARNGQYGTYRYVFKRSEFAEIFDQKQLSHFEPTKENVKRALNALNENLKLARYYQQLMRENVDTLKDIFYQDYLALMNTLHNPEIKAKGIATTEILQYLKYQWTDFVAKIDKQWRQIESKDVEKNPASCLEKIAGTTFKEWQETTRKAVSARLAMWNAKVANIAVMIPESKIKDISNLIDQVQHRVPTLRRHYVKQDQVIRKLEPVSAKVVNCNLNTTENNEGVRIAIAKAKILEINQYLQTPAYKKIRQRFNLPIGGTSVESLTEEQVKNIVSAYLFLSYKAYIAGNPLSIIHLHEKYDQVIQWAIWSRKKELISVVSAAQEDHYQHLINHIGKNEVKKTQYINSFIKETEQLLPDHTTEWKNKLPANNAMNNFNQWKINYTKCRLSHFWVNGDRKRLAAQLGNLPSAVSKSDLVGNLNAARLQMLDDDGKRHLPIKAGLDGRFNQQLNIARARLISSCTPSELDSFAYFELEDIKNVLNKFSERLSNKKDLNAFNSKVVHLMSKFSEVEAGSKDIDLLKKIFNEIAEIFAHVRAMGSKLGHFSSGDVKSLFEYCNQRRKELVDYFSRSDQLKPIIDTNPVKLFRAANHAVASNIRSIKEASHESFKQPIWRNPPRNFNYREDTIEYEIHVAEFGEKPLAFFHRVNTIENYKNLLYKIERTLVEISKQELEINFKKLIVNATNANKEFSITITLQINGENYNVNFNYDTLKKTAYCDQYIELLSDTNIIGCKAQLDEQFESMKYKSDTIFQRLDQASKNKYYDAYTKFRNENKETTMSFIEFIIKREENAVTPRIS